LPCFSLLPSRWRAPPLRRSQFAQVKADKLLHAPSLESER
jgi:hypothetical protein